MDFLNVFKMIETVAQLRGIYDPWPVGTSVAIAVLATFTALSISSRMVAAASWQARCAWAGAGACSMGGGILIDAWDDDLTAAIRGLQALIGELHAA